MFQYIEGQNPCLEKSARDSTRTSGQRLSRTPLFPLSYTGIFCFTVSTKTKSPCNRHRFTIDGGVEYISLQIEMEGKMRVFFIILLAGLFVGCETAPKEPSPDIYRPVAAPTTAAWLAVPTNSPVTANITPDEKYTYDGGNYVIIQMPGASTAEVATDEATMKALLRLAVLTEGDSSVLRPDAVKVLSKLNHDNVAFHTEMLSTGRLYFVKNGTKAQYKNISDDGNLAKVGIMNGKYKGRYAWIHRGLLKPSND